MRLNKSAVFFSTLISLISVSDSYSQSIPRYICKKNSTGAISLRYRCRSGESKLSNISTLTGATGAAGAAGSDAPSIYGDGSAGAITVASGSTDLDLSNPQFTNLSVSAGATLVVPSGSVVRLNGTFNNEGTISVSRGLYANRYEYQSATGLTIPALSAGMSGIGIRPAQSGDTATSLGTQRFGGVGGKGRSVITNGATVITMPGLFGGGAGASAFAGGSYYAGGDGGGTVVFLVKGAVTNSGTLSAAGQNVTQLAGGGGGGIIILASEVSVTNTGSINVNGGTGGASAAEGGAGGGGGGGLIRLIAPSISNTGTANVTGGSSGAAGATVSVTNPYSGGGGGGPSIGNGGNGGDISAGNVASAGNGGGSGQVITSLIDPAILYR